MTPSAPCFPFFIIRSSSESKLGTRTEIFVPSQQNGFANSFNSHFSGIKTKGHMTQAHRHKHTLISTRKMVMGLVGMVGVSRDGLG